MEDKNIEVNKDQEDAIEVDEFHKHELMDRIHCINMMFNELILTHPAAPSVKEKIDKAENALAELYSAAGEERFKE
jgi:hypothetical protein